MKLNTSKIKVNFNWFLTKKLYLAPIIVIILSGCTFSKKPEFKYIDSILVKNISLRNVTLYTDAVFNNPNHLKGKLSIDSIHIYVNSIKVCSISSQEFDIPAKDEFTIPLEGTFSLSKIYNDNKKNSLSTILNIIKTEALDIQYKGIIRYHLGDFSYPYEINKEQKVSLKK